MEEGNQSGDLTISGGHGNAQQEYAMRSKRRRLYQSSALTTNSWLHQDLSVSVVKLQQRQQQPEALRVSESSNPHRIAAVSQMCINIGVIRLSFV